MTFLLGFAALCGLIFYALTVYGWDKVWHRAAGPADTGPVVFEDFKKSRRPNQALICPEGLCRAQDVDRKSPVYALSAGDLKNALLDSLEAESRLTRVDDETDPQALRFVQRTAVLQFPDTINVRIIALDEGRSTLALLSRSQIGQSDLGVNLARLERWLKRLQSFEE